MSTCRPRDCIGGHRANYQWSKHPNRASGGCSTTGDTCHKPTDAAWTGGGFNHASAFPLVGLHATQACAAGHTNGVYQGTPRACDGRNRASKRGAEEWRQRDTGGPADHEMTTTEQGGSAARAQHHKPQQSKSATTKKIKSTKECIIKASF